MSISLWIQVSLGSCCLQVSCLNILLEYLKFFFQGWLLNAIAYGLCNSIGVYHVEYTKVFAGKEDRVALVTSLPMIVLTLIGELYEGVCWYEEGSDISGPFSSYLYIALGCRLELVVAGILTMLGYVLSMFAMNIYFLIATHVLIGLGVGLITMPVTVVQTEYFRLT